MGMSIIIDPSRMGARMVQKFTVPLRRPPWPNRTVIDLDRCWPAGVLKKHALHIDDQECSKADKQATKQAIQDTVAATQEATSGARHAIQATSGAIQDTVAETSGTELETSSGEETVDETLAIMLELGRR